MSKKRKGISKKDRFEVFKRDKFTCQYCGNKAPDVILEADHIQPHSKGGDDSILNLITACVGCNAGKSDRTLSDETVVSKQHSQLAALQERKEQMEMMFEWQKGLLTIEDDSVEKLATFWAEQTPPFCLNGSGKLELKKLSRQFPADEIMAAMRIAADTYLRFDGDKPTEESVETAWSKVGGICRMRRQDATNPDLARLFYIRGIIRNRFAFVNPHVAIELLKDARGLQIPLHALEDCAKRTRNWTQWKAEMEEMINDQDAPF